MAVTTVSLSLAAARQATRPISVQTSRSVSTVALPLLTPYLLSDLRSPLGGLFGPFQRLGGFLSSLWEGILRAVPKKHPSKSRSKQRRHHLGRAAKDHKNFVSCSSCGRPKRAHILCQYCVQNITDFRRGDSNLKEVTKKLEDEIAFKKSEEQMQQKGKLSESEKTGGPSVPKLWRALRQLRAQGKQTWRSS